MLPLLLLVAAVIAVAIVIAGGSGAPRPAPPAATPPRRSGPTPRPPVAWLGLDYNSNARVGGLTDFASRGVVYDREGTLVVQAGDTPATSAEFASGLSTSYGAGMVPDIVVDPVSAPLGCDGNPSPRKQCLPTSSTDIQSYANGFNQTVTSVIGAYPGRRVLFEPMNEPWDWASPPGTTSGRQAASEYARILVALLTDARSHNVPLTDIMVPAVGLLDDGSTWIADLYAAQPCLKLGAGACGPIMGWNLHPYGLPHMSTEGIDSVPVIRKAMLSGQNNIAVTEIGFCAVDVARGKNCQLNKPDISGTSKQTAVWLSQTLTEAGRMHQAGWLTALLLWERAGSHGSGSGWAMQNANGTLTAQGRVLDLFANSAAGR